MKTPAGGVAGGAGNERTGSILPAFVVAQSARRSALCSGGVAVYLWARGRTWRQAGAWGAARQDVGIGPSPPPSSSTGGARGGSGVAETRGSMPRPCWQAQRSRIPNR